MDSIDFAAALKFGLRLTYDQYDGVRYALSHQFDSTRNRHVQRSIAHTGVFA